MLVYNRDDSRLIRLQSSESDTSQITVALHAYRCSSTSCELNGVTTVVVRCLYFGVCNDVSADSLHYCDCYRNDCESVDKLVTSQFLILLFIIAH